MTTTGSPDDRWVDGTLESGADEEPAPTARDDTAGDAPAGDAAESEGTGGGAGAELGLQEGPVTTFEPEEERG